jgi:hypothetical protein
MKSALFALLLVTVISGTLNAGTGIPVVAVHIEKHAAWDCRGPLPEAGLDRLVTTYEGVGEIDAFVVFYDFGEAKGLSFGLDWPEAWGAGSWHDCGDLRIGSIQEPGDVTSVVWQECRSDSTPLVVGWLTLTVTSPGAIKVIHSHQEGIVAILDCDEVAPALSEAMIRLKAGAGGIEGDDPSLAAYTPGRRWHVRPDSTGDLATINETLRHALPGDTVLVAGGTYYDKVILRPGVAVLGSWDYEFTTRSLSLSPSIIHAGEAHSAVQGNLGLDSSTVLDGFAITGGSAKHGGGMAFRSQAKPVLRNLIVYSNSAEYGGGIFCHSSSPTISNCLIVANSGQLGGGIYCTSGSSPIVSNTTLAANLAPSGAAAVAAKGSFPSIEKSIVADHNKPVSIYVQDQNSGIIISCCDLWGNEAPQYGGSSEETVVLKDNISVDPGFTNPSEMDFTPRPGSPVLSVPDCGSIGTEHARVPE